MSGNSPTQNYENLMAELELICDESKQGSSFYDFMSAGYKESSRHFLTSSSDLAVAAIQPGGEEDLAKILQVIGRYKAPFAVKSGGHSMTPAFSSTRGIQISMTRFDKIKYAESESGNVLHVGAGALWGAVYRKAAKHGVGVVGGVEAGVGVGGLLLGGGYSLKSSRLGLGIDNIQAFRIVTPKGLILEVSDGSTGEDKELFNALRGGANNFGIVTRFTLKTHPQTMTYGAKLIITDGGAREQEVKQAIMEHITKEKRNTAVIEVGFRHVLTPGNKEPEYTISANCVLDAPKPKEESEVPFAAFRKIVGDSWNDTTNPGGSWNPVFAAVSNQCYVTPNFTAGGGEGVAAPNQLAEKSDDPGFREMTFIEMHRLSDHTYNVASFRRDEIYPVEIKTGAPQQPSKNESESSDDFLTTLLAFGIGALELGGLAALTLAPDILPLINYEGIFESISELLEDIGTSDLRVFAPSVQTQSATTVTRRAPQGSNNSSGPQPPLPPVDNLGETNLRGRFGCIMVSNYTEALVAEVANQAKRVREFMVEKSGRLVVIEVWPFHPSIFDLSQPDAAWPHKAGDPYSPLIASFRWERPADDEFWVKEMNRSLDAILAVAEKEGCARRDMPRYLNTSLETVPVEMIYGGKDQLEKLGKVRARYDPDDVMGRTGGFNIPLPGTASA